MYANLFGDFVKGTRLDHYPKIIQDGIFLHRSIDALIDHHTEVIRVKRLFYNELPKVSGIAMDLFFDHLLALNWSRYSKIPLQQFLDDFYNFEPKYSYHEAPAFIVFIQNLKRYQWINSYGTTYGLEKSCEGVSKKISFDNNLALAPKVFYENEKIIEKAFHVFMKDAIQFFF